jgi:excisionase family DNA binding protein
MMLDESRLWDANDLAQYLGLSVSWVRHAVSKGRIPCVRVGGWAVRFVPAIIKAWATESGMAGKIVPMKARS